MQKSAKALIVVAALALGSSAARADELRLIMTTITLPNTPASQKYHDWADRINVAGKGIVSIDVRDGMNLASSANFYDRLQSDVMQISFGSLNYLAGKFRLSQVMALPFLFKSAEEGSAVAWRLYKLGLLDAEFDQIVPLFFQVFPQQSLHLVKPPAAPLNDLKGLKIIASGQTGTSVIAALGATPLSIPLSDTYEALQRNTADGLSFPMAPLHDFKLDEVTHYHVMAELGGGPGGVLMAKSKYSSLSPEVRKIIDDNSGEPESREAGRFLDQLQEEVPKRLEAMKNQVVTRSSPELTKQWQAQVAGVAASWAANADKQRAEAVLAKARALAADFEAGK
jgi:TRAP-type transport system periplasmic protein